MALFSEVDYNALWTTDASKLPGLMSQEKSSTTTPTMHCYAFCQLLPSEHLVNIQ